jgi:hypothetical protein
MEASGGIRSCALILFPASHCPRPKLDIRGILKASKPRPGHPAGSIRRYCPAAQGYISHESNRSN